MKICLKKINNMCNEYSLTICADGGIGKLIRRNLPKCICGDGIKINIIVTGCDGILEAPALPCNNLFAISSPIKVIRNNPCCKNESTSSCYDYDNEELDFNMESFRESCNRDMELVSNRYRVQEYAIIVRSFNPAISQFLCEYPQMFITDCENTVKIIIIFDKNGSVFTPQCVNNCGGGCGFNGGCGFAGGCGGGCGFGGNCGFGGGCGGGCGFGGNCGFGGGCGCGCGWGGGLFGLAALALLFCC